MMKMEEDDVFYIVDEWKIWRDRYAALDEKIFDTDFHKYHLKRNRCSDFRIIETAGQDGLDFVLAREKYELLDKIRRAQSAKKIEWIWPKV